MVVKSISVDSRTNEIIIKFELLITSKLSAGLYTKKEVLITPLFSVKEFKKGENIYRWDKKDFFGNQLESGDYTIVFTDNTGVKAEWEGVLANTSYEKSGIYKHGGYLFYTDICIWGDTLFLCNQYNEGRPKQYRCSVNDPNKRRELAINGFYTTPDTYRLCTDGQKIYYLAHGENNGDSYVFIFAVKILDYSLVTFSLGKDISLNGLWSGTYSAMALENSANYIDYFTDIAVQTKGKFLFQCVKGRNEINIFDKNSGEFITKKKLPSASRCTCDIEGNLWVTFTNEVVKYRVEQVGALTKILTITGLADVIDVCADFDGVSILITDGGSAQQIKAYAIDTGKLLWVKGQKGGYSNGPSVSNDKFLFGKNAAIAVHRNGAIWVLDDGNNRIQQFDRYKNYVATIMYLPMVYELALDASDSRRIFIGLQEFLINYEKPLEGNNESWTLVNNWGYNNTTYESPGQIWSIRGHTYGLCKNIKTNVYWIVEFAEKGIRTTASSFSDSLFQLYPDGVWTIQTNNNLPGADIYWYRYPFLKIDEKNDLIYGQKEIVASIIGKELTDPNYSNNPQNACFGERIQDLIISFEGSDGNHTFQSQGYHLGAIRIGEKFYQWKTAYQTGKDYNGPYPTDERYDNGSGSNYPGSKARVAGDIVIMGQRLAFWKGGDGNEYKMYYKNGAYLGGFGTNIEEIRKAGNNPSAPGMAINAFAMAACKRVNTLYLYHGDEGVNFGAHRWKITGYETIRNFSIPVSINSDFVDTRHGQEIRLLENVTMGDVIAVKPNQVERYPKINLQNNQYTFIASYNNEKDYNKTNFKLQFSAAGGAPPAKFYCRKLLSLSHLDSWELSFQIMFEGDPGDRESLTQTTHNGKSAGSGLGFCIRDFDNKLIFVLDRHLYFPGNNVRSEVIAINDAIILKGNAYSLGKWYPVSISYIGGNIHCIINNSNEVFVSVLAMGANAENLRDYGFEAVCSGQGFQRDTRMYIKEMQLNVDK